MSQLWWVIIALIVREKLPDIPSHSLGQVYSYLKEKDRRMGMAAQSISLDLPNAHRARGDVDGLIYILNHEIIRGDMAVVDLVLYYASRSKWVYRYE